MAASLLCVVGSLAEEDGAEIAVAEAMDSELAVVDGSNQTKLTGQQVNGYAFNSSGRRVLLQRFGSYSSSSAEVTKN